MCGKRVQTKTQKVFFWGGEGLIATFTEVTGEKLVGAFLPPILNRVKVYDVNNCLNKNLITHFV